MTFSRLMAVSIMAFVPAACGGSGGGGDGSPTASGQERPIRPDAPELKPANLQYVGAFRVPATGRFDYGGTALGFNPANGSLFITGHDWYQESAEISIPTPIKASDRQALPQSTLLQSLADPTEGKLSQVHPAGGQTKVGGHLVYKDRLYVTGYTYYDADNGQKASHFVRPLSLSTKSQMQGPITLSGAPARWIAGYMATIPTEWQAALGGPALTGLAGVPIVSASSSGPAAAVFDPSDLSAGVSLVVGYPLDNSLAQRYGFSESSGANPIWNLTSSVGGVVFPSGSRSVLFIGTHGTGSYCYGEGGSSGPCYDPSNTYKGPHAFPYRYQVWAYDANDLADVKAGKKKAYEVVPYSTWDLDLPYVTSTARYKIGGVAYDASTQQIYVSQGCLGEGCMPVIHTFKVVF